MSWSGSAGPLEKTFDVLEDRVEELGDSYDSMSQIVLESD
jgi:hypothetical protein